MAAAGEGGAIPPDTTRVEAASASEPRVSAGIMPHEECVAGIRSALKHPTVRFLRERMEKAGCTVWPRLIQAATCSSAGGYASREGVKVCCNHMQYQDQISQVIIHELIHAYDDCVAKNMDWKNCAHHACSEIRANHLSGDCHYKRELLKGFMKIRGHEQECVKRRALASVKNNPYCSETAAKDAIEAVWDICYNDTRHEVHACWDSFVSLQIVFQQPIDFVQEQNCACHDSVNNTNPKLFPSWCKTLKFTKSFYFGNFATHFFFVDPTKSVHVGNLATNLVYPEKSSGGHC